MAWKTIMSYWSILGLAGQSSRWEQAMNTKLLEISRAAEKAAALQASAAEQHALAAEAQEAAAADEAEAAELQETAAALLEKSEADAALAASEQAETDELEAQSAAEEEQAAAHAAVAATDEVTFEEGMTEATADATEAARAEARAHGEELGVGVCEFVPFLDIACDIVGSITAVGLEGAAAAEATKASAEFAAASAAKLEEEREASLAAEFQAKAAKDAASAAGLQTDEAAEAQLAEDERAAGEAKEAEASALMDEAEVEEETVAEAEAEAAAEEEEASSLAADIVVKGVLACWDAIMASVFGMLSFAYFCFRMVTNTLAPAFCSSSLASVVHSKEAGATASGYEMESLKRDASYIGHHCGIFVLTAGLFANILNSLLANSLEARGGIILYFAASGACLQTVFLHSMPQCIAKTESIMGISMHALRSIIVLSVLYTLEILIVWVSVGSRVFSATPLVHHWIWWLLFAVPLAAHTWFLEIPYLRKNKETESLSNSSQQVDEQSIPQETDSLLPTRNFETKTPCEPAARSVWFRKLREDLSKMQIPFEALLMVCMCGLVVHCLSSTVNLWPASKALLLTTRPDWLIPLLTITGVGLLCAVSVLTIMKKFKK